MKRFLKLMGILSIALVLVVGLSFGQKAQQGSKKVNIEAKPAIPPVPNPDPGQKEFPATPNLSFPMIATDIIEIFYQKMWVDEDLDGAIDENEWELAYDSDGDGIVDNTIGDGEPVPIPVVEVIEDVYGGTYPGNDTFYYTTYVVGDDGCTVDLVNNETGEAVPDGLPDMTEPIAMLTWLKSMEPWYDQPLTIAYPDSIVDPNLIWNADYCDAANSWQAEWIQDVYDPIDLANNVVRYIDFIDWGNPLENNNPVVGQRFPVEIAIYEKLDETMTAYKMACLEYPSTRVELFGTSELDGEGFTKDIYFATVLTNKFFAEVWNPDGSRTKIPIEPGIGPSGKINFASAGGGWTPTMPGVHRIWIHFNDPLISFSGAIVNDDDHYIMSTGCMAAPLNQNKLAMSGIVGDSTFIDVLVKSPSGGRR